MTTETFNGAVRTAVAAGAVAVYRHTNHERIVVRYTTGDDDPGHAVAIDCAGSMTVAELLAAVDQAEPATGEEPAITVTVAPDKSVRASALGDLVAASIEAVTNTPARSVATLDLTPSGQRWATISRGAGRDALPADALPRLIARHVAATPDGIAVSSGPCRLTYSQLQTEARRVAAKLQLGGVRPESVVATALPRSLNLIVALAGIVEAGCAYLALDQDDSDERRARILADAGCTIVIDESFLADLPNGGFVAPPIHPDQLIYVSYTSGTTGEPKGVAVTHRAVARLVCNPDWMAITADDVFLQLAPVAFDASTLEIWGPLANGARLDVYPAGPLDLAELANVCASAGVSILWLTAGLFHRLSDLHPEAIAKLRVLLAGGDVVSPVHVRAALTANPGLTFVNGYGPTENTTFTSCWSSRELADGAVPIGRPISGTRVAVLDRDQAPVPRGVLGELYASGVGLARGYWNQPGATAERFVPDAVSPTPGARAYRTGDQVRWAMAGPAGSEDLEFLGRIDQQIKVRGFRIEPAAIERALEATPEVGQAAVVAVSDTRDGKRLVAYVATSPHHRSESPQMLAANLLGRLAETLPSYMIPSSVVVRDELPLTANGKVDRKALPAVQRAPRSTWNDYVAPEGPIETRLADIWSDTLGVEPVGAEDDFFDLGGHSLLAAELLGVIAQEFAVDISARVLYLQPTVAELGHEIRSRLDGDRD